jgi:hypothetical protein
MRNADCGLRNDNPFPAIAAITAFPGEASGQNDLGIGRALGTGGKRRSHLAIAGWDPFLVVISNR